MIEAHFDNAFGSVFAARRFVRHAMGGVPADVAAVVTTIVSELASNAVLHAATGFDVRVHRSANAVTVEVTDEGDGRPEPRVAAVTDPSGRGLVIVGALAERWGVVEHGDLGGKTVWARVGLPSSLTWRSSR
jgi:two-component sensor histidine kinase